MSVRVSRKVLRIHNIKPGYVFIGGTWVRCDDPNPGLYDYYYPGVGLVKRSTLAREVWGYNATAVSVAECSFVSRHDGGVIEQRHEEVQRIDTATYNNGVIVFTKSERRILVSKEFYFDAALQPGQTFTAIYDNDRPVGAIASASDRITRLVKE